MTLRNIAAAVLTLAVSILAAMAAPTAADPVTETVGGDVYRSGSGSGEIPAAARDVFVAGASVAMRGEAAGDGHAAGFDVEVELNARNVYAMGAAVSVRSRVAEDLTAMGASVRTSPGSSVGGNARLLGAWITVDGPIAGALLAAGGEITLDAAVGGDVRIAGSSIDFGPDARVGGVLTYSAPERITIPASVAPPDRIVFTPLDMETLEEMREDWDAPSGPTAGALVAGFALTLAFLIVVAAMLLAFAPREMEARRQAALGRPGMTLLLGVLGLSLLVGLGPVAAMTLVGVLFAPIVALLVIVVWILGYVIGAYVVGMRFWTGFGGEEPRTLGRLLIVAGAVTVVSILNFIPVLGWLCNFAVVLFGVGAVTAGALERLLSSRGVGNETPAVHEDYQ